MIKRKWYAVGGFFFAMIALATAWLGAYLSERWTGACAAQGIFFGMLSFLSFCLSTEGPDSDD